MEEDARKALITTDESEPTLLAYEDLDPMLVRPMHAKQPEGLAVEQYKLQPVRHHDSITSATAWCLQNPYEPYSVDERHVDVRAFPWHWPTGRFGMHAERRKPVHALIT